MQLRKSVEIENLETNLGTLIWIGKFIDHLDANEDTTNNFQTQTSIH